jgi:outer membrane protein assembly factor BamB
VWVGWLKGRHGLAGAVALVLLVATFAGYRVLWPGETLDVADSPPPAPVAASPMVYGEIIHAPLIVAGQVRVYGAKSRVWADATVDARMTTSSSWSYRRWPQQLVGLVVSADRLVVSKWSDGRLVAQDPASGRIVWRRDAEAGVTAYQGRRTGAITAWQPPDLYTATTFAGRPVVVSVGASGAVTAIDAATGAALWVRDLPGRTGCRTDFTAPGLVVMLNGCGSTSTVDVVDVATGSPRTWPAPARATRAPYPVGCPVGRSQCTGLAGADGGWLIGADGEVTAAPALGGPGAWLVGRTALHTDGSGRVAAYDAVTGAPRWAWPPQPGPIRNAKIIAVEPGMVHVSSQFRDLINIDVATGRERSHFTAMPYPFDSTWRPGLGYASRGFVAIERVRPGGRPEQSDQDYYYGVPSLVLAGS